MRIGAKQWQRGIREMYRCVSQCILSLMRVRWPPQDPRPLKTLKSSHPSALRSSLLGNPKMMTFAFALHFGRIDPSFLLRTPENLRTAVMFLTNGFKDTVCQRRNVRAGQSGMWMRMSVWTRYKWAYRCTPACTNAQFPLSLFAPICIWSKWHNFVFYMKNNWVLWNVSNIMYQIKKRV